MHTISNNGIITFNQGENFEFELPLNLGTTYAPQYRKLTDSDQLLFSIMSPNQKFEDGLIRFILTEKDCVWDSSKEAHTYVRIRLATRDTELILPGVYYYSLKIYKNRGKVEDADIQTIISNTKLYIIE